MKFKKILIIQGHPDSESFCYSLAEAYKNGALKSGAKVREIKVGELNFNPNLKYGYRKRVELEPSLIEAQEKILWANHVVIIFPVWWGMVPAVFKGFIDRVFLPGFGFRTRRKSLFWDKLLKGKTARIISTMDQPGWYFRFIYGEPSIKAVKNLTLKYCGFNPVKVTSIGSLKRSDYIYLANWLYKVKNLGEKQL